MSCERSLYYPLYRVDDRAVIHQLGDQPDSQEEPVAFIVIENLMMEVKIFELMLNFC